MSLESRVGRLEAAAFEQGPVHIIVGWECSEHDDCILVDGEHVPATATRWRIRLRWPDE